MVVEAAVVFVVAAVRVVVVLVAAAAAIVVVCRTMLMVWFVGHHGPVFGLWVKLKYNISAPTLGGDLMTIDQASCRHPSQRYGEPEKVQPAIGRKAQDTLLQYCSATRSVLYHVQESGWCNVEW